MNDDEEIREIEYHEIDGRPCPNSGFRLRGYAEGLKCKASYPVFHPSYGTIMTMPAHRCPIVGEHTAPTDDQRPLGERWARAWAEIGVVAAQRQGRISQWEAWVLLGKED